MNLEERSRRPRRQHFKAFAAVCVAMFCLGMAMFSAAQNLPGSIPRNPMGQPDPQSPSGKLGGFAMATPMDDEKLAKVLNADRQKSMVSDTNKLIKLVNDLNAEIAQSNQESLTGSQLHKMAEIEKLAHNVKEKMTLSVKSAPQFHPAMPRP